MGRRERRWKSARLTQQQQLGDRTDADLLPSRPGLDRTRQLLPFLLSPQGPSPAFIRVVDKYLIIPAVDAYTVRRG